MTAYRLTAFFFTPKHFTLTDKNKKMCPLAPVIKDIQQRLTIFLSSSCKCSVIGKLESVTGC